MILAATTGERTEGGSKGTAHSLPVETRQSPTTRGSFLADHVREARSDRFVGRLCAVDWDSLLNRRLVCPGAQVVEAIDRICMEVCARAGGTTSAQSTGAGSTEVARGSGCKHRSFAAPSSGTTSAPPLGKSCRSPAKLSCSGQISGHFRNFSIPLARVRLTTRRRLPAEPGSRRQCWPGYSDSPGYRACHSKQDMPFRAP